MVHEPHPVGALLICGIDKRVLNQNHQAIETELKRRFTTAYQQGRYWPIPDHGLPPCPWENWRYFAQRYQHYASARSTTQRIQPSN